MQGPGTSGALERVRSLLLVEDEEDIRDAISAVLDHPLLSITTAANGIEGLGLARDLRPDALLLDVQLPGLDGFELFRLLRREGPSVPLTIFITARATSGSLAIASDLGAYACLKKPVDRDALRACVYDALALRPDGGVRAPDSRGSSSRSPSG
jgi:two-component system OmpR family response regulator